MYYLINQFLSSSVIIQKSYNYITRKLFTMLDSIIMYSVVHEVIDPYVKTYSCILFPYITLTFNSSTYKFLFNEQIKDNDLYYYEYCIIHNNKFEYYISSKPLTKITNDYKLLKYISIEVDNKKLDNLNVLYTDFNLSADHICSLLRKHLGSKVNCITYGLNELSFKDLELLK